MNHKTTAVLAVVLILASSLCLLAPAQTDVPDGTSYRVTLNPMKGTVGGSSSPFTLESNGGAIALPAPDPRDGFTFKGWYSMSGDSYQTSFTPTSNTNLYAHWDLTSLGTSERPLGSLDAYTQEVALVNNASGGSHTLYIAVGASVNIECDEYIDGNGHGFWVQDSATYADHGLSCSGGSLSGTLSGSEAFDVVIKEEFEIETYLGGSFTVSIVPVEASGPYTVTFSCQSAQGTVSPAQVEVAALSEISASGNTITVGGQTVTATPKTGFRFDHWSDTSGTITANKSILAYFAVNTGDADHPLDSVDNKIEDAYEKTFYVRAGGSVTLRETAHGGIMSTWDPPAGGDLYKSDAGLQGNIGSETVTVKVWLDGRQNVDITLIPVGGSSPGATTHAVSFTCDGNKGSVSQAQITVADGSTISADGNSVTIDGQRVTATAANGFRFSYWSNPTGTVTSDMTITAYFAAAGTVDTGSAEAPLESLVGTIEDLESKTFYVKTGGYVEMDFSNMSDVTVSPAGSGISLTGSKVKGNVSGTSTITVSGTGHFAPVDGDVLVVTIVPVETVPQGQVIRFWSSDGSVLYGTQPGASSGYTTITFDNPDVGTGMTFIGWYPERNSNDYLYVKGSDSLVVLQNGLDLYAVTTASPRTVTLSVSPAGSGTLSGGTETVTFQVADGGRIQTGIANDDGLPFANVGGRIVKASAAEGYQFSGWGFNGATTVTRNMTVAVNFAQGASAHTVTFAATAGGSVSIGSATVQHGATVSISGSTLTVGGTTVTATPASGYSFQGWSVAGGYAVNQDATITASFAQDAPVQTDITLTIATSPSAGGSVRMSGSAVTSVAVAPGQISIASDGSLTIGGKTLTPVPASGYQFSKWTNSMGDLASGATLSGSQTVTAVFTQTPAQNTVTVSFAVSPSSAGAVSPTSLTVERGATVTLGDGGRTLYISGASTSVAVGSWPGYAFDRWTANGVQVTNGFAITQSMTITAQFREATTPTVGVTAPTHVYVVLGEPAAVQVTTAPESATATATADGTWASGLTVDGKTIRFTPTQTGDFTLTVDASAQGYADGSAVVTVHVTPVLEFVNAPTAAFNVREARV